jgi:hypothetical protein
MPFTQRIRLSSLVEKTFPILASQGFWGKLAGWLGRG